MRKSSDKWLILRKNDSASMTQRVEGDAFSDPSFTQQGFETPIGRIGGNRSFRPEQVGENPFAESVPLPFPKDIRRTLREQNLALSPPSFRFARFKPTACLFVQGAADLQRTRFRIKVAPLEATNLAPATGLFKGFGTLSQQAETAVSGNAGSRSFESLWEQRHCLLLW